MINLKDYSRPRPHREERGGFRIGALAKLADIEEHRGSSREAFDSSDAAGEAASPQIRNAGTIAGNICQRPFCWYFRSSNFTCLRKGGQSLLRRHRRRPLPFDPRRRTELYRPPVRYRAGVGGARRADQNRRPAGEKTIPLEKFFVLPSVDYRRENILNPGEIVTEIFVPTPKQAAKVFTTKCANGLAWDHAIVAVDTIVESSGGWCDDASVVMGGVAPIPWRAQKAEEFLRGKRLDEATAKQAGEIALEGAKPLKDNVYKIELAQELIQRGLLASI